DEIVRAVVGSHRGPLKAKELARALQVPEPLYRPFRERLRALVDSGRLYRVKGQRYASPSRINLVVGRLSVTRRGDGFVTPEGGGSDVFVPSAAMDTAMDGDRVVVRVEARPRGRAPEGRVIKVLERAHETIVGTYVEGRGYATVVPHDVRLGAEVLIPEPGSGGASDGDVVVVEVEQFGVGRLAPIGRIVRVLGRPDEPGVDVLAVSFAHGIPLEFPPEAEREAERRARLGAGDRAGRVDRTGLHVFTIDPADARDHDDALSIEARGKGVWEVGVHIADVSHYVDEGGPLDVEALRRGTSVYLVDRVIPMLPHALSADACSLRPDEDRLAVSVFM
ncbi:MAG: RNB domain-containing ribonuclease, partial [Gemmatimonadetes bacterium]